MSEPLRGVVTSHGTLATGFVDAVSRITGEAKALVAVSNEGSTRESLSALIEEAVQGKPAVVFVDLQSGSCLQTAARLMRNNSDISVVAGVNLAMLIDFVYNRDLSPKEAARRAVEKGGESIRSVEL